MIETEWMKTNTRALAGGVIVLILLVVAVVVWTNRPPRSLPDWVGRTAPDMTLLDLDGNPQHLAEMRGKRVFLIFWGTACVPCLEEIPSLVMLRQNVSPDSLVMLGLTGDDPEFLKREKAVTKLGLNYPVVPFSNQLDKLIRPYREIDGLPYLMVIGPDGVFEEIGKGGRSYDELLKLAKGSPQS